MRFFQAQLALTSIGALTAAFATTRPAAAYIDVTHIRFVEVATGVMATAGGEAPGLPESFPSSDAAAWNEYWGLLTSSLNALGNLRSNATASGPGDVCDYHPQDNLAVINNVRLRDLHYVPIVGGPSQCSLSRNVAGFETNGPRLDQFVGATLGYHAWSVDHQDSDGLSNFRLTNAAGAGVVKEVARTVTEVGLGAGLLPLVGLYCLGSELFGGGCNAVSTTHNLADEYNPVAIVDGLVPGVGDRSSLFGFGLGSSWHFINMGANIHRYNNPRGMWLLEAGPPTPLFPPGNFGPSVPGVGDVAFLGLADLTGLSLKSKPNFESSSTNTGITRYGQFDALARSANQWQGDTVGHVEFSPADNVARFGWEQFRANPSDGRWLGWPLHILGDASAPHHAVGTNSYGHQPFEEAVEQIWEATLVQPTNDTLGLRHLTPADPEQVERIIEQGFFWWLQVRGHTVADFPIQAFVTAVAQTTYDLTAKAGWPWSEAATVENFVPTLTKDVTDRIPSINDAGRGHYTDQENNIRPLLEMSVGSMIALLIEAGRFVVDPGPAANATCPPGTTFNGTQCT